MESIIITISIIFLVLFLIGIFMHYKVERIKGDTKRRNFFIVSYLVSLAISIIGVVVMIHSHLVNGWDGLVWLFVGGLILIFGIGLAICISIVLATQRNKESDYMLTMRDDDIE